MQVRLANVDNVLHASNTTTASALVGAFKMSLDKKQKLPASFYKTLQSPSAALPGGRVARKYVESRLVSRRPAQPHRAGRRAQLPTGRWLDGWARGSARGRQPRRHLLPVPRTAPPSPSSFGSVWSQASCGYMATWLHGGEGGCGRVG